MVCENPRVIYLRKHYPITANSSEETLKKYNKPSLTYKEGWQQIVVPCGQCPCCRIEKANEWATRITNEAESWNNRGIFLTLSYNNKNLPFNKDGLTTLKREDIIKFKKRLRKYAQKHKLPFMEWINPQTGKQERPIRTFECGEYGFGGTRAAIGGNPHYHMIIMNWEPEDLEFDKISKNSGLPIYKSKTINKIWGLGHCPIGLITYESASYVARYTMKKNGLAKTEREYYDAEEIDPKTGEIKLKRKFRNKKGKQESEFISMSTCPGIGKQWFLNNIEKIKENKCIILKSHKDVKMRKVPRYYRKIWQQINWEEYEKWKLEIKNKFEEDEKRELEKYNLPKEWTEAAKIKFITKRKIENWKAKRKLLQVRNQDLIEREMDK